MGRNVLLTKRSGVMEYEARLRISNTEHQSLERKRLYEYLKF